MRISKFRNSQFELRNPPPYTRPGGFPHRRPRLPVRPTGLRAGRPGWSPEAAAVFLDLPSRRDLEALLEFDRRGRHDDPVNACRAPSAETETGVRR